MKSFLLALLTRPSTAWRWAATLGLLAAMALLLYFSIKPPSVGGLLRAPWDKVAHLVFYTGVGGLAWVASGSRSAWSVIGIVAVVGALDEFAQSFNPARDANVFDWMADMAGAALALLIVRLLIRRVGPAQPGRITTSTATAGRD